MSRLLVRDIPRQLRENLWWYVAVFAVLLILIGIVIYLHARTHIIVTELFEDPVEFGVLPLHVGMYTYLGATSMIVAASIMLFTTFSTINVMQNMRMLLGVLGSFLLWLGLDDVFMIHEWVGLRLAWLIQSDDVPYDRQWLETPVFAAYAFAWVGILLVFREQIVRTAWMLLAFAFGGLGLSVVLELQVFVPFVPTSSGNGQAVAMAVLEDMGKLAGGFFALAYAVQVSRRVVRNHFAIDAPVANSPAEAAPTQR